jgi:hypothetical protein
MALKVIKGESTESQIASIDVILQRFQKQVGRKIVGLIPPVPILAPNLIVDAVGKFYSCILPLNGRIKSCCVYIDSTLQQFPDLIIAYVLDAERREVKYKLTKAKTILILDEPIGTGDIMEFYLGSSSINANILLGLQILPNIKDHKREEVALLEE